MGVLHRPQHPPGHLRLRPCATSSGRCATTTSRSGQQTLVLVEATVLQDVDLDPGEDAERRQLVVELGHHLELVAQALGIESMGHRQPGTVVGEGPVLVAEARAASAISGIGRPAVRPVGVAVAVAPQPARSAAAARRSPAGGPVASSAPGTRERRRRSPPGSPGRSSSRHRGSPGAGRGTWRPARRRAARRPRRRPCGRPGPCTSRPRRARGGRRSGGAPRPAPPAQAFLARLGAHPGRLVGLLGILGRPRGVVEPGGPVASPPAPTAARATAAARRCRPGVPPSASRSGTVRIVSASGSTVATSSHDRGVETWPPTRGRANQAPKTVLCGAFWLKSTKIARPRSSFHQFAVTGRGPGARAPGPGPRPPSGPRSCPTAARAGRRRGGPGCPSSSGSAVMPSSLEQGAHLGGRHPAPRRTPCRAGGRDRCGARRRGPGHPPGRARGGARGTPG